MNADHPGIYPQLNGFEAIVFLPLTIKTLSMHLAWIGQKNFEAQLDVSSIFPTIFSPTFTVNLVG